MTVTVMGQVGRDVVLRLEELPEAGGSSSVLERLDMLGGKAANQAVGLVQLAIPVSLAGVVGEDADGTEALRQAEQDGIDVSRVVRRGQTSLVVSEVDHLARRRLLEHFPDESWLRTDDLDGVLRDVSQGDVLVLQLQQPPDTLLAAARTVRSRGAMVVTDGATSPGIAKDLLGLTDVARADAQEASLIAGHQVDSLESAVELGRSMLELGPRWVSLAVPQVGDVVLWRGGQQVYRVTDEAVVDRTGAGDAFVAGLTAGLVRGKDPATAGQLATEAAAATVGRLGGRPDLRGLRP